MARYADIPPRPSITQCRRGARAPVHSATDVTAVVHTNGNTYAASLGIQTAVAIDPVYQRDAEAILTGFQVLAPTG